MSTPLAPDDPRHGTPTGAFNHGCECEPCLDARRVYQRARYHATKAASPSRASTRAEVPGPDAWVDAAACVDVPGAWTLDYPPADAIEAAKAVCRRCPVIAECADYVARWPHPGIWAGTTANERTRAAARGAA